VNLQSLNLFGTVILGGSEESAERSPFQARDLFNTSVFSTLDSNFFSSTACISAASGTLPVELGQLIQLTYINVLNTKLSGTWRVPPLLIDDHFFRMVGVVFTITLLTMSTTPIPTFSRRNSRRHWKPGQARTTVPGSDDGFWYVWGVPLRLSYGVSRQRDHKLRHANDTKRR
jgi:hypothetical protein